jgi:Protein of unknown function (DUF4242)
MSNLYLLIPKTKNYFMKQIKKSLGLLMVVMLFAGFTSMAQSTIVPVSEKTSVMKTYVIERDIPGAGKFSPEKLKSIAQTSCMVLKEMGPKIQWDYSYVTEDKIFCVYKAENIELVKEHAKKGGFPANAIYEVTTVISPATAN